MEYKYEIITVLDHRETKENYVNYFAFLSYKAALNFISIAKKQATTHNYIFSYKIRKFKKFIERQNNE